MFLERGEMMEILLLEMGVTMLVMLKPFGSEMMLMRISLLHKFVFLNVEMVKDQLLKLFMRSEMMVIISALMGELMIDCLSQVLYAQEGLQLLLIIVLRMNLCQWLT